MKICVYGAGAIGGHLAMRLSKGGADVSIIARGPHLAAIRADGLSVTVAGEHWNARLPAVEDPAELPPQDVVVVAVKQPALPAVAARLAPLLTARTGVAFVNNGLPWWYFHGLAASQPDRLDPAGRIGQAVAAERVIGGVVYAAAEVVDPGHVRVENAQGRIILGTPDGRTPPELAGLADRINAGGLAASVVPDIRNAIWSKIISNIASGPVALLTGRPLDQLYGDPVIADAVRRVVGEMAQAARALGAEVALDGEMEIARGLRLHHKPSILQDCERGRPMETEAIYDLPLALAREAGVATDFTSTLVQLVKLRFSL